MRETSDADYHFFDHKPAAVDVREEVLSSLSEEPKRLSPKYFYDEIGSKLFDQITELPEYYPTRTEIALLKQHREEIGTIVGPDSCLIEYGGGSSLKVRLLLETLRPSSYVPVDISRDHLEQSARKLFHDYDWLSVYPTSADYSEPFELPSVAAQAPRIAFFPGSSIGNFEPTEAENFLRTVAQVIGPKSYLLIGVDRKKDRATLEAAYNDSQGVTAAFNLNILTHLNERLDATFDVCRFEHEAIYDEEAGCIRMYLRSTGEQVVTVAGTPFRFEAGERIHTENSYKYAPQEFIALAHRGGFEVERAWTDENERFSLFLLVAN